MAQSRRIIQTQTTLNVSHEHETPARSSPPPPLAQPPPPAQIARDDTELVEDSLKNNANANAGDAVVAENSVEDRVRPTISGPPQRPSQQATEPEDDELYSLTPNRPRAKAVQDASKVAQSEDQARRVPSNAVDALLSRGATVHKSAPKPTQSKRPAPIVEDDADTDESARSERAGSTQTTVPMIKADTNTKRSLENHPRLSNASGALAALRARQGEDVAVPESESKVSVARPALQPRDNNARTLATNSNGPTNDADAVPAASAKSKLPSVKRSTLAQAMKAASSTTATKPTTARQRMKAVARNSPEESSTVVEPARKATHKAATAKGKMIMRAASPTETSSIAGASTHKPIQKPANKTGSLKKPSTAALKAPAKKRNTTYDMVLSDDDVLENENEDEDEIEEDEYKPTKKAQKGRGTQRKRAPAASSVQGTPAPAKRGTNRKSKAKSTKQASEPDYAAAATPAGPSNSTRARMKAVSGVAAAVPKGKTGGNDDKTKDTMPSNVRLNDQEDVDDASMIQTGATGRRLQTPTAMRSSPPPAGQPSTKPTTAGLVDPASARKSIIISFDKTGPRNQGTSARSNRHNAPESLAQQSDQDDFAHIDDLGDSTLVGDNAPIINKESPVVKPGHKAFGSLRTASQVQMPPPPPKPERHVVHKAPTVPSMLQPETKADEANSNAAPERVLGKRSRTEDASPKGGLAKRTRRAQNADPTTEHQSGSTERLTVTTAVEQKAAPSKRKIEATQQASHDQRNVKRQRSQGTVDVSGSPVPEGMVVGGLTTVLETFSQQVHLSSDHLEAEGKRADKTYRSTSTDEVLKKPPPKQTTRLSSNTKTLPAEPSQESQAVTHVARVPNGRRSFVTATSVHPPTDPFTSSEEDRQRTGQAGSSSAFSEQLRQQVARAPVASRAVAEGPQQDIEMDDPDKTLVNEEDDEGGERAAEQHRQYQQSKRMASFTSSSTEYSTGTDETSQSIQDLGVWRKALQPHQLNLFDELVIISHRLVRHLADREEASATIVDDYRSRGEELIQSLKLGHAKDLNGYVASLKERKGRLTKELEECSRWLEDVGGQVRGVRKDLRKKTATGRGGQSMEGAMEAFC